MAKQFQSIVTDGGKALIATAIKGGSTINITQLAIGDGNGKPVTPHHDQTALVHEVLRLDVNAIKQNGTTDNQVVAQAVIPASQGGFYIREVGLFTSEGTLLAVSQFPETYKPSDQEGAGSTLVVSMTIAVADTSAISLTVDNTLVMATEAYVDDAIEAHAKSRNHPDASTSAKGLVQLSSATNSTSETLAATPKAVKAALDLAAKALPVHSDPLAVDLNTLGATTQAGVYCQPVNAGATTANHYPINAAGSLVLTPSAYGCQQEYTEYGGARKFVRNLTAQWNGKDGPWGVWHEYYGDINKPPMYGLGMGPVAKTDAYSNIAQFYRVGAGSTNKPPAVTGVVSAGVVCMPMDAAPSSGYLAVVGGSMATYVGFSQKEADGITWSRIYTDKYKPTATDTQAADWTNNFAARMGVARALTGANLPTSPGVWSVENSTWAGTAWGSMLCTTNGSDLSTTPGNQKFIQYLQITHEAGGKAGLRVAANINGTFSGWDQAMMASGGTFYGEAKSTSPNIWRGIQGDYGSIWRMDANNSYFLLTNKGDQNGNFNNLRPLGINNATGAVSIGTSLSVDSLSAIYKTGINSYNSGGTDYRQTNGLTMQGLGEQVAEVYLLEAVGSRTALGLHVRGGGTDGWFECRNNGSFYLGGSWPVIQNSAGTTWHPDGNIQGAAWGNDYLSNYLNNNFVRGVKIGPRVTFWNGVPGWSDDWDNLIPQGAVNIASQTHGDDRINRVVYAYVMVNIGGNWVNAG